MSEFVPGPPGAPRSHLVPRGAVPVREHLIETLSGVLTWPAPETTVSRSTAFAPAAEPVLASRRVGDLRGLRPAGVGTPVGWDVGGSSMGHHRQASPARQRPPAQAEARCPLTPSKSA